MQDMGKVGGFAIVDFRQLVTDWYNEFLPVECKDRFAFVKDAEILYLNSINLDGVRKKTLSFMRGKVADIAASANTVILLQEPKPVNNVLLKPTLKFLSGTPNLLDEQRRLKVMHLSNRRYVPTSDSVLVSQDKEIDEFLDGMFLELSDSSRGAVKCLPLSSLPVQEAVDAACAFFPRKSLSIMRVREGERILVKSSNDVLQPLHSQVNLLRTDDGNAAKFAALCRKSLMGEFEALV